MKRLNRLALVVLLAGIVLSGCKQEEKKEAAVPEAPRVRDVWTREQANEWYKQWGWLRGADFIPSTAINQLEMWQAETFDTATINRELGWSPSVTFEQGLERTVDWYLAHEDWLSDIKSGAYRETQNTNA